MAIKITPGNTDDRAPLPDMVRGLEGKLLADKGCISEKQNHNEGHRLSTIGVNQLAGYQLYCALADADKKRRYHVLPQGEPA
jgi:hypothetical protein